MKSLTRIGTELVILWLVLWFTASNWFFPSFSDVGDVAFGLIMMYLALFIGGTILYLILRHLFLRFLAPKK